MNLLPRITIAAAVALIAHGCANMQWTKAGVDRATVTRDQDACRAEALRRGTAPVSPAGSADATTDGRRSAVMSPSVGSNERFIDEQEAVRSCMIRRGYELRPAS